MSRRRSYTQPPMFAEPCNVCPRDDGEHEHWCPNFMQGAAPGGDPSEWERLFDLADLADNATPRREAA